MITLSPMKLAKLYHHIANYPGGAFEFYYAQKYEDLIRFVNSRGLNPERWEKWYVARAVWEYERDALEDYKEYT